MAIIDTDPLIQEAVKQEIMDGKTVTLCVTGKSMRPYLSGMGNDFVIVSRHHPEELKKGVIILFIHNGKYIFHRIIKKTNDLLIAQGDGNHAKKEEVKPEDILGIVRYIITKDKRKISPYRISARIYWHIWYILRPVRKYLLFLYNRLKR